MDSFKDELLEGRLCEKGLLKERYDEKTKDLVRTMTPKGTEVVRNLIKDDVIARKMFLQIVKDTINRLPKELHRAFIEEVKKELR